MASLKSKSSEYQEVPVIRRSYLRIVVMGLAAWIMGADAGLAPAVAAQPEISYVHPDFPGNCPHILTGQDFDPKKSEVWIWEGPRSDSGDAAELEVGANGELALPARPPETARRVQPLDMERQVIVAPLQGIAVWVKTPAGFSKPKRPNTTLRRARTRNSTARSPSPRSPSGRKANSS
jgi:hypothetical protein